MPRPPNPDEDALARGGLALLGLVLLAGAALALELAREHMATLAELCGSAAHPHCGWCSAAAGLAVTGMSALVMAARSPALRAKV